MRAQNAFAGRNIKELLRDPLTLVFGIGFPGVILLLIAFMKRSIPEMSDTLFPMPSFAPGMAVFGLSFLALFLGMLIASDRESSFLVRIFTSPLDSAGCLYAYGVPLLPVALAQGVFCFGLALLLGLDYTPRVFLAVLALLCPALLFIALGLLLGSLLTYRQVGGISSVLINVAAWLSGTWFDLEQIGGAFRTVCYILPFAHAVNLVRDALAGSFNLSAFLVVMAYSIVIFAAAVLVFRRKMKN